MKILYVTTISGTINGFLQPHIEMLLNEGHIVDLACNITNPLKDDLLKKCNVYNIEFQRSPIARENYLAYKKLKKIIEDGKYDIVHTHTPVASVCVRLACRNREKIKVIYTAHGFHFFRGAPIKNWFVYYVIEYMLSNYTDILITINNEDYNLAKKKFKAGTVEYIPGVGFDTKKFRKGQVDKFKKRKEIGIEDNGFIVLSVGEINRNKNHETIIRAISKLNSTDIYYVICGQGPLEGYLRTLSKELGIEKQVKLLGFRRDIQEICNMADVFAFPSMREGLGMAALEAMASGLPLVTSNVHGIVDYSINGVTGYSYSPKDVYGFAEGIRLLKNNPEERLRIGNDNLENVKRFDLSNVLRTLSEIYEL